MKRLMVFGFLFFALSTFAQKNAYEIECVRCELEYAETYCSTCPNKSGVGVSLFEGIEVRDKRTGKVKARIPAPFKPKLVGGYVEIRTQTSEMEVDGYPTRIKAKFEEYVLSDYSKYPSFSAMVDSLKACGACILTETGESYDDTELRDSLTNHRAELDLLNSKPDLVDDADSDPTNELYDDTELRDSINDHRIGLDALAGAEQNVQTDWNETDTLSDAFILDKPPILNGMFDVTNQNTVWSVTDFSLGGNTNMSIGTNFLSMKSLGNQELFVGNLVLGGGTFSLPAAGYKVDDGTDYIGSFSTDAASLGGGKSVVLGRFYGNTVGRVGVVYDDSNKQVLISHSPAGPSNQTAQIIVSDSKIILETPDVIAGNASAGDLWALKDSDGEVERIDPLSLPFLTDFQDTDDDTGFTYTETGTGIGDQLTGYVDGDKFFDMFNNTSGVRTISLLAQDVSGFNMLSFTAIDTITANTFGLVQEGSVIYDNNIGLMYNNGSTWLRVTPEERSQEIVFDGVSASITVTDAPNNLADLNPVIKRNGVEQMSINIASIVDNVATLTTTPLAGEIAKVYWTLK